ncbi:hypothetical protein KP509_32G054100 [Ceratopteris richardii]|uniref:Uncharacterized protein n=1 Tax=Ceratopteris richardii TaxID=49495 RepID=A0A8T2QTX8_CERRI|nr:hypothetical protein KP509_32G054100 [Ceratopteris richardii]
MRHGLEFKRRMRALCDSYLHFVPLKWIEFDAREKKYVLSSLEIEFGIGWSHKWCLKEMRIFMEHHCDNARLLQRRELSQVIHHTYAKWAIMVL